MTLPAQIPKSELDLTYHGLSSLELVNKLYAVGRDIVAREEELQPRYYALGGMMAAARRDPEFLATAGFDKFGDFESHLLKETGLFRSPSSLWQWKKISEQLPELTRDQLAVATSVTFEGLKSAAEEAGYLGAAPVDEGGANLILTGAKDQISAIREFLEHEEIVKYNGTSNWVEILLCLIAESQGGEGFSAWPKIT